MTQRRAQRVQTSRQHKDPPNCFRAARPSMYANRYRMKKATNPYEEMVEHYYAVERFREQMEEILKRNPAFYDPLLEYDFISCYCPLHLPCHVDMIIEHLTRRAAQAERKGKAP